MFVNTRKLYSRIQYQLTSSPRIYRVGTHYGIKKYLKSLRFWENQIWTGHKCWIVCFILREEHLLHVLLPDKCAFLEMEKSHFPGPHQANDSYSLCESRLRTSTKASLDTMWAHKSIFEHTMESHLSLGSLSIMYQGREGGFETHLYKSTKRRRHGDHIVMLVKVAQATLAVCGPDLELKRTRSLATQHLSPKQQRERDTASETELGRQHPYIRT